MLTEKTIQKESSSTFIDNMSLPIHRWFRYSAGFSSCWVETVIDKHISEAIDKDNFSVLDPFAGSGTTLLAAEKIGVKSYGYEAHPLISRIANTKLMWFIDINNFKNFAYKVLSAAKANMGKASEYPNIVHKCYNPENLSKLDRLRKALELMNDDTNEYWLSWLAFVSILRCSSHAGTATWQYVLPNKTKARVSDAFDAYEKQVELMCIDMERMQLLAASDNAELFQHDARKEMKQLENSIDLVITSPPYANNYDYADATRLELSVLGEIKTWGDLQTTVRTDLIRSCSQMVSKERKNTFNYLEDPILQPIYSEIVDICSRLDDEKELHGGKKNYHTMIALYFLDLAKVWINLRKVCKEDSTICFVIGDSAPYGIYVPVDEWLGKLAISAGFKDYHFEKIRDRNVKWKNRKHRVPLKEGHLWIKG